MLTSADKRPTLNLLMVHRNQHEAEPILNTLRNAGQATRSHFAASLDELETVLQDQTFDLLCLHLDNGNIEVQAALETVRKSGKDLPVIGLTDEFSAATIEQGLATGMEDVVPTEIAGHLVHSVHRAHEQVLLRRRWRQLEQLLEEAEHRCELLLEASRDAIAYVHEGMHIYANEAYRELFGYDDMDDLSCMPLVDLVRTENSGQLKQELKKVNDGKAVSFNATGEHESGETFDSMLDISPAIYEGEHCLQVVIRKAAVDNTDLQAKVREMATYDNQTNLRNRAYFDQTLVEVTGSVAHGGPEHVLAFIQVADFNNLKTSLGIAGADELLVDLAERLNTAFAGSRVVARFQDDVFTVLCESSLSAAREKIGALIADVSEHLFELNNQTLQINLHAGLTSISDTSGNSTQILTQAHEACMLAIRENVQLRAWEPGASDVEENNITTRLRTALENDDLRVLFQPIINLRQGSEENYEVLVRIRGENDQLIAPQEFLDAADVADLAGQIDRWVFQRAVAELGSHRRERGTKTRAFIHLTASSIQDSTFLPWANTVLREARLPGDAIVFQVSERVLQNYLKVMKAFAKGLSVLHIGLAAVQFTNNEKSALMFQHLKLNFVKVDPSFVKDLDRKANQERLTQILASVHEHETSSMVPHIESAAILGNLWQLGVHYVQGFYLQAPAEHMEFHFEEEDA